MAADRRSCPWPPRPPLTRPPPPPSADELIGEILRLREVREHDADPGDVTITVQDDMPLVEVVQRHQTIGRGSTLVAALEDARDNVTAGSPTAGVAPSRCSPPRRHTNTNGSYVLQP